jgi:uncharacterized protein (DUF924 family)
MSDFLLDAPDNPDTPADISNASRVLRYWLADGLELGWPSTDMKQRWFGGGPELDREIQTQFGAQVELALAGGLSAWENHPLSCLARVILQDQFSRNIFRGQAKAFAGDHQTQSLVQNALARNLDQQLPWVGRVFMYMPLMHAEDLIFQEECVRRFTALLAAAPPHLREKLSGNLDFAKQHRDISARFDRLPYRNQVLGRTSTAQELDFLKNGPRFGQ